MYCSTYELEEHEELVCCIPSIESSGCKYFKNITEGDVNGYLGNPLECYLVVKKIFEHLEFSDLQNAKLVNWTWNKLAISELKKRDSVEWIIYSNLPKIKLSVSCNYKYTNAAISIVAYDATIFRPKTQICFHTSPKPTKLAFPEYVKKIVPPNVQYFMLGCTAIAPDISQGQNDMFKGILIPRIPNIHIEVFSYNPKSKKPNMPRCITNEEEVKCILLFPQHFSNPAMTSLLNKLLKGQNQKNIALGGGLFKLTRSCLSSESKSRHSSTDLHSIVFIQDKGVDAEFNAYSLVIKSDEVFEKKISDLKTSLLFRKHGIIFKLCCYAKWNKSKESDLLYQYFPEYPVLGMEVDGEIGWNKLNEDCSEIASTSYVSVKRPKYDSQYPEIWHAWTTILVFITWGRKITNKV